MTKTEYMGGIKYYDGKEERFFQYVDVKAFDKALGISSMLQAWRWDPSFDEDGNITGIYFQGEVLGDDRKLMQTLAPYVKSGSYIQFTDKSTKKEWRWGFYQGVCKDLFPKIIWTDGY